MDAHAGQNRRLRDPIHDSLTASRCKMVLMTTAMPRSAEEISEQTEVHDRPAKNPRVINVGMAERKVSLLSGGALIVLGLSRKSLSGLGIAAAGAALASRGITGNCPLYQATGQSTANDGAKSKAYFEHGIHVESSVTINRPAGELFKFWRDFANLPRFMHHLENVQVIDEKHSRWVAKAPFGMSVQWDAEIINEEPDALIAWRSIGSAEVDNAGSVRFLPAPGDRGTEVRIVVDYVPPAGKAGAIIARLFSENPHWQIKDDLRRFKQITEAGEIATTQGQPQGTCKGSGKRHFGI
jgi:uncharacterized membrane protein